MGLAAGAETAAMMSGVAVGLAARAGTAAGGELLLGLEQGKVLLGREMLWWQELWLEKMLGGMLRRCELLLLSQGLLRRGLEVLSHQDPRLNMALMPSLWLVVYWRVEAWLACVPFVRKQASMP